MDVDNPQNNYGDDVTIIVNTASAARRNSLVRWDVSGLTGQTVSGVNLKLEVSNAATLARIEVYPITRQWNEGNNTSGSDATWLNARTGVAWTTPGGDYDDSNLLGSFAPTATGEYVISSAALDALVQEWIDGTTPNYGLILVEEGRADEVAIRTREAGASVPEVRPELVVTTGSGATSLISVADTHIRGGNPTNNYGTDNTMLVLRAADEMRGLVRWDLSSLPSDATVVNATMRFNIDTANTDVFAIRVHQALQPWVEGIGANGQDADWMNYATSSPWGTPGGDFVETPIGSFVPDTQGVYKSVSGPSVTNLVSGWLDGSIDNEGVLLSAVGLPSEAAEIVSSEGTVGAWPELVVNYVASVITQTVNTQPPTGFANGQDTYIAVGNPGNNYGDETTFVVNTPNNTVRHSLLRFDLSALAGQTVNSANLKLTVNGTAADTRIELYPVTTSWTEAGATWNNAAAATPWTTAGGDYNDSNLIGSFLPTANGNYNITGAALNTLVQSWINNGATNFGLILVAEGIADEASIRTREQGTPDWPVLTVTTNSGTSTLQPVADTHLRKGNPTNNYGTDNSMLVVRAGNETRGIVQWDLSAYQPDVTVTDAKMRFYVDSANAAVTVNVHQAIQSWVEGIGDNNLNADWLHYDQTATVGQNLWATPGGDYLDASLGSFTPSAVQWYEVGGAAVIALVQGWLDDSIDNDGVFLLGSGAANQNATFVSAEAAGSINSPELYFVFETNARSNALTAGPSLVADNGQIKVTMELSATETITDVSPSALNWTGLNGAAVDNCVGPTPATQDVNAGSPATFEYTCDADTTGVTALPASLVFSATATSGDGTFFDVALSNSVLLAPELQFQVTATGAADPVVNTAQFADSGIIPVTEATAETAILGSIGDFVWADLNGDGVQDPGEPGLGGVEVCATLQPSGPTECATTAPDGSYRIYGLVDGTYDVTTTPSTYPAGYLPTTSSTLTRTLVNGTVDYITDADFGLRPPGTSSIGDTIWIDANENGMVDPGEEALPNVTVNLYDATGALLIATTTTDENGNYSFDGLHGATYQVQVDESSTVTVTNSAGATTTTTIAAAMELVSGSATNPVTVNLPADTTIDTVDFGYNWAGSIGDYTYYDPNATQDPNGAGTSLAPLVTVLLYEDTNGNGVVDPGEPILVVGETDGSGLYIFDNLPPGDYIVNADEQTVASPTDGSYSSMVSTTGTKHPVSLAPSEDYTLADFGFIEAAELEGHVFHDVDNNGVLGGTEPGIGPVEVTLTGYDTGGNPVSLTTTTANSPDGEYSFLVPPGTYTITYSYADVLGINPALTSQTTPDSITRTVDAGQEIKNLDFGVDHSGAIGDLVWQDIVNDNVQGVGEPGIAGATVELYLPGDIPDVDSPFLVQATDANGKYLFEGLEDGTYTVRVLDGVGSTLENFTLVSGTNPQTATVSGGSTDLSADFGYQPTVTTYPIAGTIWDDIDGDGILDPNEEIAGVTVQVDCGADGVFNVTSTAGPGANWAVAAVPDGASCTVNVNESTLPTMAYVNTGDPDVTPPNAVPGECPTCDSSTVISVNGAPVTGIDFGYFEDLGSISGYICEGDTSGQCTVGEPPIPGVDVTLTYAGPDGILGTVDDTQTVTQTNGSGYYIFPNLGPGLYSITKVNPANYNSVSDADGGNPDVINKLTTTAFLLAVGQDATLRDFEMAQAATGNPDYVITKTLDTPDTVRTGDTITFTIRISNSGDVDLTTIPLEDRYQVAYMSYVGASIEPDDNANDGQINWADLTAAPPNGIGAPLQPGQFIDVKVEFVGRLDTTQLPGSATVNTAEGMSVVGGAQVVPNKIATDTVRIFNPTAALIAGHSVSEQDGAVTLSWETVDESQLSGFHLYRTDSNGARVKLTEQPIAAQLSGQSVGAVYSYVDEAAPEGVRLGYELEVIMLDGTSAPFYLGAAQIGGHSLFLPVVSHQ